MQFSKLIPLAFATLVAAETSPLATFWNYPGFVGDAFEVSNDQQCIKVLTPSDAIPTIVSIKVAPGFTCYTYTDKKCKNFGSHIEKDLEYIPGSYNYKSINCHKN